MLGEGIRRTLGVSGRPDVAIVLRKGSDAELSSSIDVPAVGLIRAQPGVQKDSKGIGIGIGEVVVVAALDKIGTNGVANVQIRGVPEDVLTLRPEVKVTKGRMFRPGTDEVVVGERIEGRFKGISVGQSFEIKKNRLATVVGVFEAGGSLFDSEVWADIDTVRTSFGREGLVSSVRAKLEDASKFAAFEAMVEQDKRLGLEAMREPDFYEKQSEGTRTFVIGLGTAIAIIFSLGAMIGAMITMYGAVSSRQRDVGTLRALGFRRRTILGCFLIESVLLSLVGGIFGICAAMLMGFVKFSMMNFTTWSEIVFTFSPTPQILLTSMIFALVMGVLGGLFPAVRAARISTLDALRA